MLHVPSHSVVINFVPQQLERIVSSMVKVTFQLIMPIYSKQSVLPSRPKHPKGSPRLE